MPVPLNFRLWGLLFTLSLKLTVPVSAPGTTGLKERSKTQWSPAARLPEQAGTPELAENVPLAAKLEILRAAPLTLVTVTLTSLVVVPTTVLPNWALVGEKRRGAEPPPDPEPLSPPVED